MWCSLELLKTKKSTFKTLACVIASQLIQNWFIMQFISNENVSRNDSDFMRNLNCNPLTFTCSIKGQRDSKERWLSFSTTFFLLLLFDLSRFNYGPHWRRWQCRDNSGKVPLILSSLKISHSSFRQRHTHVTATTMIVLFTLEGTFLKNWLLIWHLMSYKVITRYENLKNL